MSKYNQDDSRDKKPVGIVDEKLFQDKKTKTDKKQEKGNETVMMFAVSMIQGIGSDAKCYEYHRYLKCRMMNDIDTK